MDMFGKKKEYVTKELFNTITDRMDKDINKLQKKLDRHCSDCKHCGTLGWMVVVGRKCLYPYFYTEKPQWDDAYDSQDARGDSDLCGEHGAHWELLC